MKYNNALLSLGAAFVSNAGVYAQSGGPHGGVPFPKLGWNNQPVDQDDKAIAKNFPNLTDTDLLSPAFLNPDSIRPGFHNGSAGPTHQKDLEYFLENLAKRNTWLSYDIPDFLSEEGRSLPFLHLAVQDQSNSTKLRVYIQGAIHGNEPSADQGLMALLGKMDADSEWVAGLLDKMEILIMPRYNPDGVNYFQREFASNLDPNRDHAKLVFEHTRNIRSKISDFQPHVVVDMHEFAANNVFGGYRHGLDAMLATCGDLNVHQDVRNLSRSLFVAKIEEDARLCGLRAGPYVLGTPNKELGSLIAFNGITISPQGLDQAVFILLETRGQFLASQHFQRRVATQLVMIESILNTAREQAVYVRETIENAVEDFISSDDIALSDEPYTENRTFPLIDIRDGKLKDVNVRYTRPSVTANITRERPEAYLIPRNWAIMAEKLRFWGVEVEELPSGYSGKVSAYNITSSKLGTSLNEGIVQNIVTVKPLERNITLVPGSFRVSTRQKNAALAMVALEPDHPMSYVSFGFFPLETGYEYPIFREQR